MVVFKVVALELGGRRDDNDDQIFYQSIKARLRPHGSGRRVFDEPRASSIPGVTSHVPGN